MRTMFIQLPKGGELDLLAQSLILFLILANQSFAKIVITNQVRLVRGEVGQLCEVSIFLLEKFRSAIKDSNKLHLWRFLYPRFTPRKPSISFGLERTGNDCPRQRESSVCHCYWYATGSISRTGTKIRTIDQSLHRKNLKTEQ